MSESSATIADGLDDVPRERRPRHIAVIMDGNGRWAERQGLPRIEGHRHGVASVRRTTEECTRLGIRQLTLYCLSSENWKRPQPELDFLMHLLEQYMIEERTTIMKNDVRVSIIGRREGIPEAVLREMDKTVDMTADNRGLRLCLAVNYGARGELLDAVRRIARQVEAGKLSPDEISEETLSSHLYTAGMPPAGPHGRRDAREQLPVVADQLCGDLGDRGLLARIRRTATPSGDPRVCRPRPTLRRTEQIVINMNDER